MGVTLTCGRCGHRWTIMAGSPNFYEAPDVEQLGGGAVLLSGGSDVCEECATKDGGFCTACMCKPCRRSRACASPKRG